MKDVVVLKFAVAGERIHDSQPRWRTLHHRHSHSSVERDDRRRLQSFQEVVKAHDLRPVGFLVPGGLAMQRGNRRLHCEWTWSAAQRLLHEWKRFGNLFPIPTGAILVLEKNEFTGFIQARIAARVVKQHQREEAGRFGGRLRRH